MLSPSRSTLPSILHPSTKSFILLSDLSNVDLPQPEGPIKAVIFFSGILRFIFLRALKSPYYRSRLETSNLGIKEFSASETGAELLTFVCEVVLFITKDFKLFISTFHTFPTFFAINPDNVLMPRTKTKRTTDVAYACSM